MEKVKTNKKIIITIITIIILAKGIYALGIAPSSVYVTFRPELEKTILLKIINSAYKNCTVTIYAGDGSLKDYITINQQIINFSENQEYKIISYNLILPEVLGSPGVYQQYIVAEEIPDPVTGIGAHVAVVSKLKVTVEETADTNYDGKISMQEIILYVEKWKTGELSTEELIGGIGSWEKGETF